MLAPGVSQDAVVARAWDMSSLRAGDVQVGYRAPGASAMFRSAASAPIVAACFASFGSCTLEDARAYRHDGSAAPMYALLRVDDDARLACGSAFRLVAIVGFELGAGGVLAGVRARHVLYAGAGKLPAVTGEPVVVECSAVQCVLGVVPSTVGEWAELLNYIELDYAQSAGIASKYFPTYAQFPSQSVVGVALVPAPDWRPFYAGDASIVPVATAADCALPLPSRDAPAPAAARHRRGRPRRAAAAARGD